MSGKKWTPGPWSAGYCIYGKFDHVAVHGQRPQPGYIVPCVCLVAPRSEETEEDKANARLIAAAPELYDVLEELLGYSEPPCGGCGCINAPLSVYHKAKAALAKARGEG